MAKLHKQNDGSVPVTKMKDGDLAVITQWVNPNYVGRVVQRHRNFLIAVGENQGKGLGEFFYEGQVIDERLSVRILQPGELIEV